MTSTSRFSRRPPTQIGDISGELTELVNGEGVKAMLSINLTLLQIGWRYEVEDIYILGMHDEVNEMQFSINQKGREFNKCVAVLNISLLPDEWLVNEVVSVRAFCMWDSGISAPAFFHFSKDTSEIETSIIDAIHYICDCISRMEPRCSLEEREN